MPEHTLSLLLWFAIASITATVQAVEAARPPVSEPRTDSAEPQAMTPQRMLEIALLLDDTTQARQNTIEFTVDEHSVLIVFDEAADRMRMMVPISKVEDLEEGQLMRMMQANFDSALDARYAIARDVVWSVFIHPLASLNDEEFVVGLGEMINVAATFGESYSSGMFVFGGGDSGAIERRKLIDKLKDLTQT